MIHTPELSSILVLVLLGQDVNADSVLPRVTHLWPDTACGARVSQFILDHYHVHDVSLIDIIRQVQPKGNEGISLETIDSLLRSHGVSTASLRIAPWATISWDYPVVVLLKGPENGVGHFVVQLPSRGTNALALWDGMMGNVTMVAQRFSSLRSGEILLTAPFPIADPSIAIQLDYQFVLLRLLAFNLLGLGLVALAAYFVVSYSSRNRGTKQSNRLMAT